MGDRSEDRSDLDEDVARLMVLGLVTHQICQVLGVSRQEVASSRSWEKNGNNTCKHCGRYNYGRIVVPTEKKDDIEKLKKLGRSINYDLMGTPGTYHLRFLTIEQEVMDICAILERYLGKKVDMDEPVPEPVKVIGARGRRNRKEKRKSRGHRACWRECAYCHRGYCGSICTHRCSQDVELSNCLKRFKHALQETKNGYNCPYDAIKWEADTLCAFLDTFVVL